MERVAKNAAAAPAVAINLALVGNFLIALIICLIFWLGTRKMSLVPGRGQSLVEMGLAFVRKSIAHDLLGEKIGDRFLPILTTIFFLVLGMNLTGIIPGLDPLSDELQFHPGSLCNPNNFDASDL